MKLKDFRKLTKGMSGNTEIMVDTGLIDHNVQDYGSLLVPVKKAKMKLQKKLGQYPHVQSRPHKDKDATISLILE